MTIRATVLLTTTVPVARTVLATALLVTTVLLVASACSTRPQAPASPTTASNGQPTAPPTAPPTPAVTPGPQGVRAAWVQQENQRPGTTAWRIDGTPPGTIEGFADRTYAAAGESVGVAVSTDAASWHLEVYRMGYYQGTGARLVRRFAEQPGRLQDPCPVTQEEGTPTNTVSCASWTSSLAVPISGEDPPGDYLLKLVGDGGQASYVPLTVWDPTSHAAYLVKNDVFTWQAWNPYGGFDFYDGRGECGGGYPLCSRARVVSYDRPYAFGYNGGQGTGDFLALEYPLVRWMEQQGLDVSYVTDVTVVDHPEMLAAHRALLSLGHDECWANAERVAAEDAHARGLNLAFFGASGVLRHVRLDPTHRKVIDYRDSADDPLNGVGDPREVTGNTWASPPASWPEEGFVGSSYNGYLRAGVTAPLHVTDPTTWIFAGTGVQANQDLPGVIGSDVDSLDPPAAYPPTVQVLSHSLLPADDAQTRAGATFSSDMTWWTDPTSGAGVWDSGTNNWIPALQPCPPGVPCPADTVGPITGNLFRVLGTGPAGRIQPSVPSTGSMAPITSR